MSSHRELRRTSGPSVYMSWRSGAQPHTLNLVVTDSEWSGAIGRAKLEVRESLGARKFALLVQTPLGLSSLAL